MSKRDLGVVLFGVFMIFCVIGMVKHLIPFTLYLVSALIGMIGIVAFLKLTHPNKK